MGKIHFKVAFNFVLTIFILSTGMTMSAAADVSIKTKEELKAQLNSSDVMILDVRAGKDWKSSEFKIKGAVRANPNEFNKWAEAYSKDKTLILYCA